MPDDHRHPSRDEQQREEQRQRERKEREREREQQAREAGGAEQRKEREKKERPRSKEQREKREKDEDGKPRTPGQRNVTSSASPPSRHHCAGIHCRLLEIAARSAEGLRRQRAARPRGGHARRRAHHIRPLCQQRARAR